MRSNNLPVHFIKANGFDLMCHKQANLQLQYELTYVTDNLLNLFLGKKNNLVFRKGMSQPMHLFETLSG
jgi:hypothetical protein